MAHCSNCDKIIDDAATLYSECGSPVRGDVFEGSIYKCPNCGGIINNYTLWCPICGHALLVSKESSSVSNLARQLLEIESRQKENSNLSDLADSKDKKIRNTIDEQKIELIRSFPIPNTKEEILDFLILAYSNIDDSLYEIHTKSAEKNVSNAWLAKTEQVYKKAKYSFGTEPDFDKIQSIYDTKMRAVKKSKRKVYIIIIVILIMLILDLAYLFCVGREHNRKEVKLETQLNSTFFENQQDIMDGSHDRALLGK